MHAQVHARAATLRVSTSRFFVGSVSGRLWSSAAAGNPNRTFFAPTRSKRPSGHGRTGWQWQLTRARLDVAVRPETYREELDLKIDLARAHFAGGSVCSSEKNPGEKHKTEIELPRTEVFESLRSHFRMRAEFRVWHEGDDSFLAMFDSDDPRIPVQVETFPMGSEKINELMKKVVTEIRQSETLRKKLFQVNFLTTTTGEAMVSMLYHRRLSEQWETEANAMRDRLGVSVVGRSKKQKVVLGDDFVYETLTVDGLKLKYKQLEGGFTQPNAFISGKMLEWAKSACLFDDAASGDRTGAGVDPGSVVALPRPRRDDFLELYCGNGNFTVALSPLFRKVLATEISKVSVTACKENLAVNSVDNVHVVRLSSEELTKALDEGKQYNRLGEIDLTSFDLQTVLVDPPRAGMGPEVTKFVSRFSRIVYISCNPETLAEDIRALRETHVIARFAAFDQFPYTPHLECGALLVAKE